MSNGAFTVEERLILERIIDARVKAHLSMGFPVDAETHYRHHEALKNIDGMKVAEKAHDHQNQHEAWISLKENWNLAAYKVGYAVLAALIAMAGAAIALIGKAFGRLSTP